MNQKKDLSLQHDGKEGAGNSIGIIIAVVEFSAALTLIFI